jgi:hypothetical protein
MDVGYVTDTHYFEVAPTSQMVEDDGLSEGEEETEEESVQSLVRPLAHLEVEDGECGVFNLGVEGLSNEGT